jgi:hypothetical protein
MLAEIQSIASSESATAWARVMLGAKNTLMAVDARIVERAFETKIAALGSDPQVMAPKPEGSAAEDDGVGPGPGAAQGCAADGGGRNPPITKTVRHRNQEHLRFIRTQPCLVCAKQPSDPHHLPFAQPRALGRKVSDQYAVPLCRAHHREAHRATNEITWWQSVGIGPLAIAEALWQRSQSGQALVDPAISSVSNSPRKATRAHDRDGVARGAPSIP